MKGKLRYMYPGGNTSLGFHSYYNYILPQRKAKKIVCIKGGPGTGKSTFIKGIGEHFAGKKEDVDFLKCSADPSSYDGVLLQNRDVLIVDGTAPHVIDPVNPAVVDVILDFGVFWDEKELRKYRESIINCNEKISRLYGVAYGYLKCLKYEYDLIWQLMSEYVNDKQVEHISSEIIMRNRVCNRDKKGMLKKMFVSAITSEGTVNEIDSMVNLYENAYVIKVPEGFRTENIINPMISYYLNNGYDVEAYYCPLDPKIKVEHIIVPDLNLIVVTSNKYHQSGNKCDYEILIDNVLGEYAIPLMEELYRQTDKTISNAVRILKKAKEMHDLLETYYIKYIDFVAIDKQKIKVINEIEQYI